MKSRILINVALLALVVVLGYVIVNLDTGDDIIMLSEMEKDRVQTIEIQHRDRYILLRKQGDHWRMIRPINIAANDFRINTLLNFINAVSNAQYPVAEVDLSKYKLDKPRTSVRYSDGVQQLKVEFGTTNPINRMRYVSTGDTMHLIKDNLYPLVSSQKGTLISLDLVPEGSQIISLKIPGHEFTRQGVKWQSSATDTNLDSDAIVTLIDGWEHSRAFGVHDYMEREHLGEVSFDYQQQDQTTGHVDLIVTDTDPWLILGLPELGIEYHLDISLYDLLFSPGHDADRAILDAEQSTLTR